MTFALTLGAFFIIAGWLTEDGWPAEMLGVCLILGGAVINGVM